MAQSGVSADTILRRMRESNAVYRLSASQLADLRDQGVPDEVIDYMQRTHLRDARYREGVNANRHYPWTFGPYWRHSPYYWRHPYWW